MADQRVVDYLRDGIDKGHSLESLRNELLKKGWDSNEVNEAALAIQKREHPGDAQKNIQPTETKRLKRPIGVTVISILGLLLSGLLLVLGLFALFAAGVFGASSTYAGLGILFLLVSILPTVMGALGFAAFYLLFKMRFSGFVFVIILGLFNIGFAAWTYIFNPTSNLISIVIWAVILIYLIMVRKSFG